MNNNENTKPKPIQPIATITKLSHDGRGIATIDDKTTFLAGCLPGETVHYRIHQKKPAFQEGKATDILTSSPMRATPPCRHFGVCGGCSLQHMTNDAQLEQKQETLLDQLKHFGKVAPEVILTPLSVETEGYRRKARLGVKHVIKKEKVLVGFREKSSRYLAELESCKVLHPEIGNRLTELAELVASLSCYNRVPQIEVSIGDETVALIFRHLEPFTDEDRKCLSDYAKKHQFHIYLQPNSPASLEKLWPLDNNHRLTYSLPQQELTFQFHPTDFTQVNLPVNRLMVNQALQLLDPQSDETVLDLFSGIGNFTLPIAKLAKHVTGVEGSVEMVERGYENAKANEIENVSFFAANLAKEPGITEWTKTKYDKVLLDPPRAGALEILPLVAKSKPKRIVYISCNPATLARDAGELVHQHRYKLTHAGIMNMFPHTAHIEAMAVFERS